MESKIESVHEAVDKSQRNDGQEVDIGQLIEELEKRGWSYKRK